VAPSCTSQACCHLGVQALNSRHVRAALRFANRPFARTLYSRSSTGASKKGSPCTRLTQRRTLGSPSASTDARSRRRSRRRLPTDVPDGRSRPSTLPRSLQRARRSTMRSGKSAFSAFYWCSILGDSRPRNAPMNRLLVFITTLCNNEYIWKENYSILGDSILGNSPQGQVSTTGRPVVHARSALRAVGRSRRCRPSATPVGVGRRPLPSASATPVGVDRRTLPSHNLRRCRPSHASPRRPSNARVEVSRRALC
jgi:hypothetical protein